jgi:hypothetical protein
VTSVKTVGSARGTSSGTPRHEDLVWLIANEMKPWKHPKGQVVVTVRYAIETLRGILAVETPSGKEQQHAEKLILAIHKLNQLIHAAPPRFFSSAVEKAKAVQATSGLFYHCLDLSRERAPKRRGWKKTMTACCALSLIEECSTKKPAAGNRDTAFCMIASWLFEVVTGEPEPNLEYDCKRILRLGLRIFRLHPVPSTMPWGL